MHLCKLLGTLLTLVSPAVQQQTQSSFPIDVELALVFPQPNHTYKPVYPFPIVLGMKGAAAAWPYHINVRWILQGLKENSMPEVSTMSTPLTQTGYSEGVLDSDLEPLYLINGSDVAKNLDITEWQLTWFVNMQQLCEPAKDGAMRYASNGSIWFSTSSNGTMPNMTNLPCPRELQAFQITANKTTPDDLLKKGYSSSCLEISENVRGDPCKFNVGSELDAAVKSRMLEEASCPANASWPDDRILEDPDWCNEQDPAPGSGDEEDHSISIRVSYVAVWVGLGASTFWFFLM